MVSFPVSLLTATDAQSHVHLVVGTNPLAASRCAQSLQAGAKPVVVAPEDAEVHYALQKRIDDGEVRWLRKPFDDQDLFALGRDEVDNVVDAVFVTSNPRHLPSECPCVCFFLAVIVANSNSSRAHF